MARFNQSEDKQLNDFSEFCETVWDSFAKSFPQIEKFDEEAANKIIQDCYDSDITPSETSNMLGNYFS